MYKNQQSKNKRVHVNIEAKGKKYRIFTSTSTLQLNQGLF